MEANRENGGDGLRPQVLIVANEAIEGEIVERVVAEVRQAASDRPSAFVVAPALAESGLKHELGDIDEAIALAQERLEVSLRSLREAGLEASGEVGDSDPVAAISDELQKFDPEEIVLVAHSEQQERYAEGGLLERADRQFDPPIRELIVERQDGEPSLVGTDEAEAGAARAEEGWQFSANAPPITPRDGLGILVAVLGTLALIILAAECQGPAVTGEEEPVSPLAGACAVRYLIAGGAFLLNLAHVVGLFLFQSVSYRGVFEKFFAKLSLYGTPAAIVVSVLVA